MTIGLYIHIPFCKQKCFYCDFPSYSGLEDVYTEYTQAICREIRERGSLLKDKTVDTIFIGGGTPTLLRVELLIQIIQAVKETFNLASDAEFSLEANPGTLKLDKLKSLRQHGINRISFGVQSFNDNLLKEIGRIHSGGQACEAVESAKEAGFTNINIDLIYGLPKQTLQDVLESLAFAVDLSVQHISVYGLKVEEGTVFAAAKEKGTLYLPNEELEEAMYDKINDFLPEHNFERYEISNFAKANFSCRHNIKYWSYQPYIGVGAAAYSFCDKQRFGNTVSVRKYIDCINSGQSPVDFCEEVDEKSAMAEFVFLALRMTSGLNIKIFNNYFKTDFFSHYKKTTEKLVQKELLTATNDNISLTARGMKFGNIVFEAFLPE